jgi:hypothetical protein
MASEKKEKKVRIEVMTVNDSQTKGCTTVSAAKFDPDFWMRCKANCQFAVVGYHYT